MVKKYKISNNKGITLIALVVTIILLIILAGISLHILLPVVTLNDGIELTSGNGKTAATSYEIK